MTLAMKVLLGVVIAAGIVTLLSSAVLIVDAIWGL